MGWRLTKLVLLVTAEIGLVALAWTLTFGAGRT